MSKANPPLKKKKTKKNGKKARLDARKRQFRKDLRKIREQQKSPKMAIQLACFLRFIRHYCSDETRINRESLRILHEAFEANFIRFLRVANMFTNAGRRITLSNIDIKRAQHLSTF